MEQPLRLFTRSMGRWLMALLLVTLSSLATRAAQVEVLMGDVGGNPGETVCIPVYVNCDVDMTALQITFSTDLGVGFSEVGFTNRIDRSATTYCSVDYGKITVVNFGGVNQTSLKAGEGLVMEIYVDIPADAEPGDYTMTLSNIQFQAVGTQGDSSLIRPNDVHATLTVNALALEAYANYTPSNSTLTFYYDSMRSSRTGTTYDLPTTADIGWHQDDSYANVTKVVFDPSFAGARPTRTYAWFRNMENLQTITGMDFLNTSAVTSMYFMFRNCSSLTTLDLSGFNTANVTNMQAMFMGCSNLQTIYVGEQWSTDAVTTSTFMFSNCTSLVGGKGTAYNDSNPKDKTYAHIDGGPSNPGYFTEKGGTFLRGDVNGDGHVTISDVTALIDLLLGGGTINNPAADCNNDSNVTISDVTALIDYLLGGSW